MYAAKMFIQLQLQQLLYYLFIFIVVGYYFINMALVDWQICVIQITFIFTYILLCTSNTKC